MSPVYAEPNPETNEYSIYGAATAKNHPLTDLEFIEQGHPWPPPSSVERLMGYETNRLLWKGLHDRVFDSNWYLALDKSTQTSVEIVLNWHKRLSTLWADLLLSEAPRFLDGTEDKERDILKKKQEEAQPETPLAPANPKIPGEPNPLDPPAPAPITNEPSPAAVARQEAIDRITSASDNGYVATLYKIAIDVSRFGDGVGVVVLEGDDGAMIYAKPPGFWFPVVAPDNLEKFVHHVLAHTFSKGDYRYLWTEVHDKGSIRCRVNLLEGNTIGPERNIAEFSDRPSYQNTGVEDFLVVPFQGLKTSDVIFGVDDYSDIDSVVCAIEARIAQINKILTKHSDPPMYGPAEAVTTNPDTGDAEFKPGGAYFRVDSDDGDEPPGYVVWEPQMEAQFKELEFLVHQLYIISETSPAAFGQIEQGLVESGSALRRLMQAPLAKVARISIQFDPAARRAIQIAADLEHLHGVQDCPKIDGVQIQWQDGLPPDPKEQAETEKLRKDAGNTSLVSSIRRLDGGTDEDAEAELERIEEENQRTAHTELQGLKAQGAIDIAKVEAQAEAKPPPLGQRSAASSGKNKK